MRSAPPMDKAPGPKIKKGGAMGCGGPQNSKMGKSPGPKLKKITAVSLVLLLLGLSTFVARYFVRVANPHPLRPCRRGNG